MINLFCCIGVDEHITNLNLLYHFFDFYKRHGVAEFYIILQSNSGDKNRVAEARNILREFNITEKFTWMDDYHSPQLYRYLRRAAADMRKTDWMIPADLDEFHNFPVPAKEFLKECDTRGINCVKGRLLDKVAKDGELKTIKKGIPIDRQFPFCADITKELAKGNTGKITAFKKPLIPGEGHHSIFKKKWRAAYHEQMIDSHHFKWDSLAPFRLEKRYRYYSEKKIGWYGESERVYRYLETYKKIMPGHFTLRQVNPLFYPLREEE